MGLGKYTGEESSNGSSSSGSSSSSYPKVDERVPQYTIEKSDDGVWSFKTWPECTGINYIKENSSDTYTPTETPDEIVKLWWNEREFDLAKHRVQERFNEDLLSVLKEDPKRASRLIEKAASRNSSRDNNKYRTCSVCECDINIARHGYEEIGNRVVCDTHTVQEMKEADLL